MRKIVKFLGIILVVFALVFSFYLYKLHSLAVEGNNLFGYRCAKVNPHLIGYKNSFLKFADAIMHPDKYSTEEARSFYDGYISGMRRYITEEDKWLVMQQKYIDRWDFRLVEPWYMKQAAVYQLKMYQGYRDDVAHMLSFVDNPKSAEGVTSAYSTERQTRDLNTKIYFDFYRKAQEINDWRKIFGNVPLPKECTPENLNIPDTSGAIDWYGKPSPSPVIIPDSKSDKTS